MNVACPGCGNEIVRHGDCPHCEIHRLRGVVQASWTPAQGEHYRLEMHRHAEARNNLIDALNLDKLERCAVEAITDTYGPEFSDTARFWLQKGIEGMRLAVAKALEGDA